VSPRDGLNVEERGKSLEIEPWHSIPQTITVLTELALLIMKELYKCKADIKIHINIFNV
jgi:hypothetical protein